MLNRNEKELRCCNTCPLRQCLTLSMVRAPETCDMQEDWSWTLHKVYSHNLECCVTSSSPNNYNTERSVGDHQFQHTYHLRTYLRTHTITSGGGFLDSQYYLPQ